ncbi:MAG: bifunctional UDP-N-acetylglucosamine diphosphorylase/glucosamine-1-phosphate N-acetyltransferase GlmU [Alphaproteobacteria bacterium]
MALLHPLNIIILAAGKGTRMKSATPKVFHAAAGRTLVEWVLAAANELAPQNLHVVVGPESEGQIDDFPWSKDISWSVQRERLGTGHAVMQAAGALSEADGYTLVLYADTPLVTSEALARLVEETQTDQADVALTVFETEQPAGYGRIVLDDQGRPLEIVEAKDATPEQLDIKLCNGGLMLARNKVLFDLLSKTTNDNAAGEFYITDVVGLARKEGLSTRASMFDQSLLAGVNSRQELAAVEGILQSRLRARLMDNGVTMIAPETVTLCFDTQVGADTVIEPNVFFGPGVTVGTGCRLRAGSYFEGAQVGEEVIIGPMARLREGTVLGDTVKVGNFVEIKKAHLARGAKAPHLTYVGDAEVGEQANLGAGTITCNYDGVNKHRTTIGKGAFIGSNAALVAPVSIGDGALVGAGSTITADVPANAIVTTRGTTKLKENAAERYRERLRAIKARQTKQK